MIFFSYQAFQYSIMPPASCFQYCKLRNFLLEAFICIGNSIYLWIYIYIYIYTLWCAREIVFLREMLCKMCPMKRSVDSVFKCIKDVPTTCRRRTNYEPQTYQLRAADVLNTFHRRRNNVHRRTSYVLSTYQGRTRDVSTKRQRHINYVSQTYHAEAYYRRNIDVSEMYQGQARDVSTM